MPKKDQSDIVFIKRLNTILENNYSKEDFGVKELAAQIGFSHTQLHRKIKSEFGKSTSQYIREFRLEKAVTLLQENTTSVADVAYSVGFSSPTYFNKSFHSYFGYPPGEVKYRLNENSGIKKAKPKILSRWKKLSVLPLVIIVLLLSIYTLSNKDKAKSSTTSKNELSVAVLPFKNLSEDKNNQHFADGVMDDIINHLSAIKELRVISRTTMDLYKESSRTIPEIGKELQVSYIIESTIQKYQDSVRLIIQLIEAENDKNVWAQDFRREFKNIFSLESEIAKKVASELKATISPNELERIERAPTENMDAYNLYLKGNYSFNSNNNDSLLAYKNHLNQILELDPDFAMAYAALARIKIQRMRAKYLDASKSEIEEAKRLAIKSIDIDDNARGHASLGWLYLWFEWNWKEAEKQFRHAIQINPNYAGGHVYLAELLFNIKGDITEARKHLDIAMYLAPYAYYPRSVSASFYFNETNFTKSIEEAEKLMKIDENNTSAYYKNFLNYIFLGKETKAVNELQTGWEKRTDNLEFAVDFKEVYGSQGIEGVYRWIIDYEQKSSDLYSVARFYALLGDKENAISLLEKCYEMHDSKLPYIKSDYLFKDFHSDSRFLNILNKMKLSD